MKILITTVLATLIWNLSTSAQSLSSTDSIAFERFNLQVDSFETTKNVSHLYTAYIRISGFRIGKKPLDSLLWKQRLNLIMSKQLELINLALEEYDFEYNFDLPEYTVYTWLAPPCEVYVNG